MLWDNFCILRSTYSVGARPTEEAYFGAAIDNATPLTGCSVSTSPFVPAGHYGVDGLDFFT